MDFQDQNRKFTCFLHYFGYTPKGDIDMKGQQVVLLLLPKTATDVAKNCGSCKERSELSVDIFMASWDLLESWSLRNPNFSKQI